MQWWQVLPYMHEAALSSCFLHYRHHFSVQLSLVSTPQCMHKARARLQDCLALAQMLATPSCMCSLASGWHVHLAQYPAHIGNLLEEEVYTLRNVTQASQHFLCQHCNCIMVDRTHIAAAASCPACVTSLSTAQQPSYHLALS